MASATAEKLYTPQILGLAVELARYPLDGKMPLQGEARSQSCGSALKISLACHPSGSVEKCGMQVAACAIGQASAAIFARHVIGTSKQTLAASLSELQRWLDGDAGIPSWPEIETLNAARGFPARHGAILLPWRAAMQALSNAQSGR